MEREHLNGLNQQHREILPGEEEIRLALDWDLLQEQWRALTSSQIKRELFSGERITPAQIGRVLAKLARDDEQINVTPLHNVRRYTLPLRGDFDDI